MRYRSAGFRTTYENWLHLLRVPMSSHAGKERARGRGSLPRTRALMFVLPCLLALAVVSGSFCPRELFGPATAWAGDPDDAGGGRSIRLPILPGDEPPPDATPDRVGSGVPGEANRQSASSGTRTIHTEHPLEWSLTLRWLLLRLNFAFLP